MVLPTQALINYLQKRLQGFTETTHESGAGGEGEVKPIYWCCPYCRYVEKTTDFAYRMVHQHQRNFYALLAVKTLKEANHINKKWKK